jgi:hypothetical protein
MDEPKLSPEALYDAVMILAEGMVLAMKPHRLERWRRACERLIAEPTADPVAREAAATWIRGLFRLGRTLRS